MFHVAKLIVCGASICVTLLGLFPFCLFCTWKFKKYEDEPFIQNRFPNLVYFAIFQFLFGMVIINVIEMIDYGFDLSITENVYFVTFYQFFTLMDALTICLKYWLVIFKFKHQNAIVAQKWQSILNPNQNLIFWIKYKQMFGMFYIIYVPKFFVSCLDSDLCTYQQNCKLKNVNFLQ